MIPAAFEYEVPETIEAAVDLLRRHGDDAKIITGGQSLIPMMRYRLARPEVLIDLRRIDELSAIRRDGDDLILGARATHDAIARSEDVRSTHPILCETAAAIGDRQIRHLGTIGGSVVHADPAADWPAALLASEAVFHLRGPSGGRDVAATDFFKGVMETAIASNEILHSVRIPAALGPGAYRKIAQSASGFALAGCAAVVRKKGGTIAEIRVGLTGVSETPVRATAVENALTGQPATAEALGEAASHAADGLSVLSDIHAADDYRAHLASVVTRRAIAAAAGVNLG